VEICSLGANNLSAKHALSMEWPSWHWPTCPPKVPVNPIQPVNIKFKFEALLH
jgi:hypothetical protein